MDERPDGRRRRARRDRRALRQLPRGGDQPRVGHAAYRHLRLTLALALALTLTRSRPTSTRHVADRPPASRRTAARPHGHARTAAPATASRSPSIRMHAASSGSAPSKGKPDEATADPRAHDRERGCARSPSRRPRWLQLSTPCLRGEAPRVGTLAEHLGANLGATSARISRLRGRSTPSAAGAPPAAAGGRAGQGTGDRLSRPRGSRRRRCARRAPAGTPRTLGRPGSGTRPGIGPSIRRARARLGRRGPNHSARPVAHAARRASPSRATRPRTRGRSRDRCRGQGRSQGRSRGRAPTPRPSSAGGAAQLGACAPPPPPASSPPAIVASYWPPLAPHAAASSSPGPAARLVDLVGAAAPLDLARLDARRPPAAAHQLAHQPAAHQPAAHQHAPRPQRLHMACGEQLPRSSSCGGEQLSGRAARRRNGRRRRICSASAMCASR